MNSRLKNWLRGGAAFFLLEVALVAALAAMAAHWTWIFVAPAAIGPSAYATPSLSAAGEGAPRRNLFGVAHGAQAETASSAKLKLVGVASPTARQGGRAVFVLEGGKSKAARSGESVAPGAILREVHPDHVLLERNGALERLTLERRNGGR